MERQECTLVDNQERIVHVYYEHTSFSLHTTYLIPTLQFQFAWGCQVIICAPSFHYSLCTWHKANLTQRTTRQTGCPDANAQLPSILASSPYPECNRSPNNLRRQTMQAHSNAANHQVPVSLECSLLLAYLETSSTLVSCTLYRW